MRVLFVEDDAMNRRVVRDMLNVAGAEMEEAENAATGLNKIDQENFSLVLMDLRMPGMDGLTAISHIRSRSDEKARLPIIVVTADTGVSIRDDCLAGGADEVLMKPVAMSDLFGAIGSIMAERSALSTMI